MTICWVYDVRNTEAYSKDKQDNRFQNKLYYQYCCGGLNYSQYSLPFFKFQFPTISTAYLCYKLYSETFLLELQRFSSPNGVNVPRS